MISSTRLALGALLVFDGLYASAMRFDGLLKRDATTNAVCGTAFTWMNSEKGLSPCLLAAKLIAPCHANNWNVPSLPADNVKYDNPTGDNAEGCTCSWAVYNLISACASCQGKPQAVRTWPDYILECPAAAVSNNSFYPSDRQLSTDVTFPVWAAKDPTTWGGSMFTQSAANSLYGTGPDLPQPSKAEERPQESSSSSAGPIAGGVVGGVVVLLGAAALVFFLLKRHRQKTAGVRGMAPSDIYSSTHYRSQSDTTDKTGFSMGYTNLSSTTAGFPPGRSATIRTHNTSIYPFSTFGAPDQATNPQRVGPSPPPVAYSPPPNNTTSPAHSRNTSANREDIITPFVLQQPISDHSADRKTPLGNVPQYDSPNAPPARAGDALFETPQRNRMNPPAYSPHDTPSPPPVAAAAGPSRTHLKNGSADTHRTNPSFSGNNAVVQPQRLGDVGRTESGISDIYTSPPESVSGVPEGTTLTRTGTTATSAFPRDVKRRPDDIGIGRAHV